LYSFSKYLLGVFVVFLNIWTTGVSPDIKKAPDGAYKCHPEKEKRAKKKNMDFIPSFWHLVNPLNKNKYLLTLIYVQL
jgi:hypothetical protein|tara:strand:+ start:470 stop:703 length:234 start_codon:yes stop_codon:yes gene_type:complete